MNSTVLWDVTSHRSSVMFRRNILPPCSELRNKQSTKLADGTQRETKLFIKQFSPAACNFPFRRSRRQRKLYKEIRGGSNRVKALQPWSNVSEQCLDSKTDMASVEKTQATLEEYARMCIHAHIADTRASPSCGKKKILNIIHGSLFHLHIYIWHDG
jgi:hypothetical protein